MSWREALIEHYEGMVGDLKKEIADLESGSWEIRSRNPDGTWLVLNDGIIVRNRQTIKELEGIVAAAKKDLA